MHDFYGEKQKKSKQADSEIFFRLSELQGFLQSLVHIQLSL